MPERMIRPPRIFYTAGVLPLIRHRRPPDMPGYGIVEPRDESRRQCVSGGQHAQLHEIPRFPPECFAYLHNPNPGKFKQFRKGMDQLLQEGVIQVFHLRNAGQRVPLLAAVGPLQFEVVQYRLESEYGAPSRLESAPWESSVPAS